MNLEILKNRKADLTKTRDAMALIVDQAKGTIEQASINFNDANSRIKELVYLIDVEEKKSLSPQPDIKKHTQTPKP